MTDPEKPDSTEPVETPSTVPEIPKETTVDPDSDSGQTEDVQTDKAVDDIIKKESDDTLKAQDEASEKAVVMQSSRWESFKNHWATFWENPRNRWGTILALAAVVGALFAVPYTRYNIVGLVLKSSVTVGVVDSKTGQPVSGALVELNGKRAETQANGQVTLRVKMGTGSLKVSKKYYAGYTHSELVESGKNSFRATLVATGRQVKIKLVNKITNKPVSGATVSASGARAKTDKQGAATVVIPSGAATQAATVTADGYDTANVSITATDDLSQDTFSITPSGKLYFLSNLSGKIDVVKTNLDGSERQTVLAGTGNEAGYSTSLLASRDWKYLALLAKRSGDKASIYLIDTTNGDKLSTIDEGSADFSLVGWSGDQFVYTLARSGVTNWQSGQSALKSFDPTTGHTLLLDQTQATGTDQNNYAGQSFGTVYLLGDSILYTKNWNGSYNNATLMNGKSAELDSISADGSGHKVIKSFTPATTTYTASLTTWQYELGGLYISFESGGSAPGDRYRYEDGKITADQTINIDTVSSSNYPTYLISPSGNNTFWSDQRDGKNTLFIGDKDGKNQKQIATLSPYNTYGWFTDDYLLVSKDSSELYIMSKDGGTPLKITDYYKPAINYNGYGGGYGGL